MSFQVLLVDDDAFQRAIVRRMVEHHGAQAFEAADGKAALHMLDGNPIDLVLIDLNMPGMDGVEFLRHVAARESRPPVAVLSGEDDRVLRTVEQLAQAHSLTMLSAMSKPPTPADIAAVIESAKTSGPSTATVHPDELSPGQIRAALDEDRVVMHYQPKAHVGSWRVEGVEALVRLVDDDGRVVYPDRFIHVAEEAGLSLDLTRAVLRRSASDAQTWASAGWNLGLAINVSVADLFDPGLVDEISDMITSHGLPAERLVIELTESRILGPATTPVEILTRLRLRGVSLAIDDFGTGASTLAQLQRLPFSSLKIDRAFVHGAASDEQSRSMLESTVRLAAQMGLETVAEGVERTEDLQLIVNLGVDVVQGYILSRPMPNDALLDWLASHEPETWAAD